MVSERRGEYGIFERKNCDYYGRWTCSAERWHQCQCSMSSGMDISAGKLGRNDDYDMQKLWTADENIRALKSLILVGIRDIAAYLNHTNMLNYNDSEINEIFYKALFAIGMDDWGIEDLFPVVIEVGKKI